MLSPYFGTSHFVWTAQIAITLLSLAVGYWFGGCLADRSPGLGRMYACILVSAFCLCLTVFLCPWVADRCLDLKLALGSLLASLFLFFVPLALLATVGPFIIRALTASVTAVGGQVGQISALSTAGSVLGTVLVSYVLIPLLPNSTTMYLTGMGLMALATVYFFVWGKRWWSNMAVIVALYLAWAAGLPFIGSHSAVRVGGTEELERCNSNFGLMQVLQAPNGLWRFCLNDYLVVNGYDVVRKQSIFAYTCMLHGLAHAYTTNLDSALCIGLGVGILPMQLANEGVKVDVVEINPAVVPLAQKYFDLQPERLHIVIDDGRHFLNGCQPRYDAILLDAFLGDSMPSHLMTREAFAAMRQVLHPGGTLVINSAGSLVPGRDFLTASVEKTLRAVFQGVRVHASQLPFDNIYFVASDRPELAFIRPPDVSGVHPMLRQTVEEIYATRVATDSHHGRVLTDDFNPVEFYDAANRERWRRSLAIKMRPE